ncbi:Uncharacterised protein [Starkeya nomas]|uniref:DUF2730 family protein n=1 Tax=Starkeya nomas TaxID=2666134 RepID=A0A5S9R402_9HYPH|nr:DUF2730 family protein [Starkeya nomas]CAA0129398.1 Uncharacterised protein [Starkeya nomas]
MEEFLGRWGAMLISATALIFSIASARGKAASDRVGQVEKKSDETEQRVARLETEMRHLPDKDTSHRLELAIIGLRGEVSTLGERMKPVAEMAERVHHYMFEERVK